MKDKMYLILKYNDDKLRVDTIRKHKELINEKGKVIWGIIKPSENSPGIGKDKIKIINKQIENDENTYAYMCTRGKITSKGKIERFLNSEEIKSMKEYVPTYYRDELDKCVGGVLLTSITDQDEFIIDKMQRYGSVEGEVVVGNQTNPLYISFKEGYEPTENINEDEDIERILNVKEFLNFVHKYINTRGFIYSKEDIYNFYLSLKTKPFVILVGISGTGKSKLVRLFADGLGSNIENERLSIISVRPDWSDNTELIGYKNITGDFTPGKLIEVIQEAQKHSNRPYFVCLDEMNLARVEYYLSDYLSIIESRERVGDKIITDRLFSKNYIEDDKYKYLTLPENLYLIGTVNMDDTTYAFSRKVLDRANTIELSKVELKLVDFAEDNLNNKSVHNDLLKSKFITLKEAIDYDKDYVYKINELVINLNEILIDANKQFGYRVRDEIIFYMLENKIGDLLLEDEAMDYQIMQKILPTISGSDSRIKNVLIKLFNFCNPNNQISNSRGYIEEAETYISNAKYIKSAKKIVDMLRELEDGFTSYWV